MIDIGAYANLRKLANKFREVDVTASNSKEECRNAPVLEGSTLIAFFASAPGNAEALLIKEVEGDDEGTILEAQ